MKDEDEEKKRRVANLEAEEAKWTEIKAEVDQRRAREQQEHNNYVYEAKVCIVPVLVRFCSYICRHSRILYQARKL